MVCSLIGWIISVICRDDKKIIFPKYLKKFAEFHVKAFQFFCVSFYVSSVSPKCIKIYQIHKAKSGKIALCNLDRLLHSMNRAFGLIGFRDSFPVKNIPDFSDRDHIISGVF